MGEIDKNEEIELSKIKSLIESIEKMKEIQKIQYDYFKHLTTMSTGSLGVIVAFITKLFESPGCIVLAILSLASFCTCLVGSLWVMPVTGNVYQYLTAMQIITTSFVKSPEERMKDVDDITNKFRKSLNHIHFFDLLTQFSFLVGILLFLIFVIMNLK